MKTLKGFIYGCVFIIGLSVISAHSQGMTLGEAGEILIREGDKKRLSEEKLKNAKHAKH